jgi:KipI family sensor histidine kinase inhibitor
MLSFGDDILTPIRRGAPDALLEGVRGILNVQHIPPYWWISTRDCAPPKWRGCRWNASHHRLKAAPEPRHVRRIPVHYGGEFGPDLGDVARHTGLTEQRVVELHAAAEYLVYFVGFSTCFPYLGGLPPELATPRLAAPRKHVPVGSVAIGGAQAGIYPLASPGGWRLIGRTHVKLFDPAASPPPLLRMGDRVRFVPLLEFVPMREEPL